MRVSGKRMTHMKKPQKDPKKNTAKPQQRFLKVEQKTELLSFLIAMMPEKSRSNVKSLLAHRQIAVNDNITTQFNHPLEKGNVVTIHMSRMQEKSNYRGLKIVFEDPYMIVIDKQSGLMVTPTAGERKMTAFSILNRSMGKGNSKKKIYAVHRMDRDASGLMVFAKDKRTQIALQQAKHKAIVKYVHTAVVEGKVSKPRERITSWLMENSAHMMYSSRVAFEGKEAVTNYKLIKQGKKMSMLEVETETDIKHQIRVHMQEIGHSLIGDKKYGSEYSPAKRMGLHASKMSIQHPVSGKLMNFESSVPRKLRMLFEEEA